MPGKWGSAVSDGFTGFQILPDVLIRGQRRLGISNGEMVTLLNLLMHWWEKENLPYPKTSTIARRMGTSQRTVERHLKELQAKGLVSKVVVKDDPNRAVQQRYDLSGLVNALELLAEGMRSYTPPERQGGIS